MAMRSSWSRDQRRLQAVRGSRARAAVQAELDKLRLLPTAPVAAAALQKEREAVKERGAIAPKTAGTAGSCSIEQAVEFEGAPRECERAGDTARVYRADSEAFAAKVLCVHRTYGKWDFPLVTHFRFSGWLLGSFPEIVYPVNLKHCS